ncbi:MAG: hypothetical protein ACO4CG_10465 [Prochlorothrix sp.]|nr:hypothetical protein [Prochlorothrix sp.]
MNPLRSLQNLPWQPLFLAGLLNGAIALVFMIGLRVLVESVDWIYAGAVMLVSQRVLFRLCLLGGAIGWGALGVVVVERFFPQVRLNGNTLWALLFCMGMAAWVEQQVVAMFVPGVGLLLSWLGQVSIGVLVGVFWKGKRYWR